MTADDDTPRAWFEVFRSQSIAPEKLGTYVWGGELNGGQTGARVALYIADEETIVLKWAPLDEIVSQAAARRALADAHPDRYGPLLEQLRTRGASHIAIRPRSGSSDLFGIIASPYVGSLESVRGDAIVDFQTLVHRYLRSPDEIGDDQLKRHFARVMEALTPSRSIPVRPQIVALMPDLTDIESKVERAAQAFGASWADAKDLEDLTSWINLRLGWKIECPDAGSMHGDPRFANVFVDLDLGSVSLIDFGEGRPDRHVFHDLARFEADVLLRSTPTLDRDDRTDEISARVALVQNEQIARDATRADKVAALWRDARNTRLGALKDVDSDVFALYSLFLMNELLRRAGWFGRPGATRASVGATPAELVTAIGLVRRSMDGHGARAS